MRDVPAILHRAVTALLVAVIAVQVWLAGRGVFESPSMFATHRDTGYAIELLALVVLVVAAWARAGRAQIGRAGLVFLLVVLQSVFVAVRETAPAVAALHPVNGFLIALVALVMARAAWRGSRPTVSERPQEALPAEATR